MFNAPTPVASTRLGTDSSQGERSSTAIVVVALSKITNESRILNPNFRAPDIEPEEAPSTTTCAPGRTTPRRFAQSASVKGSGTMAASNCATFLWVVNSASYTG